MVSWLKFIAISPLKSRKFPLAPHFEDEIDAVVRQSVRDTAGLEAGHQTLFQRWKEKRKPTILPVSTTTLPPGSLADLNIRLKSLEDQVTNLYKAVLLEEQQIAALSKQLSSMSAVLTAVYNAVITSSG
jgi:hypothetical protein